MFKKLLLSTALLLPVAAQAASPHDYLQAGVGYYDLFDDKDAASFNLEYQFEDVYYGLRPVVGAMATSDSAAYGYAGARWDVPITANWLIAPTFNIGAYRNGDGKNLGHGLEFRSGIEVAYAFEDETRLGLHLSHISNASIGDSNPGTEILQATYAVPVGF